MKKQSFTLFILVLFLKCRIGFCDGNTYSPIGKRDPFSKKANSQRGLASKESGLFRFRVDQFELKAIRKGPDLNQMLILDPEGGTYIITEGEQIGKTKAIVSRILDREVILSEQTVNYLGKPSISERILSLPDKSPLEKMSDLSEEK